MTEPEFLNPVTVFDAYAMVGLKGMVEIEDLLERLGAPRPAEWVARFAPSIIVRSEAELFGVAMPRFAIRVYLNSVRTSFLNVRRLNTLCKHVPRFVDRERNLPEELRFKDLYPREALETCEKVLERSNCVADCVLQAPEGITDLFYIMTVRIGMAYGESIGNDFTGTPYMKHIPLGGGGLCAQAACFMATVLLCRKLACPIFGLVEITKAASPPQLRELCISGLTYPEMIQYFATIGLTAKLLQTGTLGEEIEHTYYFRHALAAYVHSDMPVILPTDAGRLAGEYNDTFPPHWSETERPEQSVYAANNWPGWDCGYKTPWPHVVLVVGASKDSKAQDFVIQDPGSAPFMKATARQLANACSYTEDDVRKPTDELDFQVFMPVTPPDVQTSLLPWMVPTGSRSLKRTVLQPGLFEVADFLQGGSELFPPVDYEDKGQFEYFRLVPVADLNEVTMKFNNFTDKTGLEACLKRAYPNLVKTLMNGESHWIWVQCTRSAVWVWDAERSLHSSEEGLMTEHDYLTNNIVRLAIYQPDGETWQAREYGTGDDVPSTVPPRPNSQTPPTPLPKPTNALITSTSVKGFENAIAPENWVVPAAASSQPKFAELYCFMQSDGWLFSDFLATSPLIPRVDLCMKLIAGVSSTAYEKERVDEQLTALDPSLAFQEGEDLDNFKYPPGYLATLLINSLTRMRDIARPPLEPISARLPFLTQMIEQILREKDKRRLKFYNQVIEGLFDGKQFGEAPPGQGILNKMVEMAAPDRHAGVTTIAEKIHTKCVAQGVRIVSFATFIPEILSIARLDAAKIPNSPDVNAGQVAVPAFCFLGKLALELRKLGHPAKSIELVGGSLIDGIWSAGDRRDKPYPKTHPIDVFGARVLERGAALDRLLDQLTSIADDWCNNLFAGQEPTLALAIEMEPGPLYCVGDFKQAQALFEKLAARNRAGRSLNLAKVLGLNLDIPHWAFLGKDDLTSSDPRPITAQDVRDSILFEKIVHGHISDHFNGHFCDDVLLSIHPNAESFLPWVNLLAERQSLDSQANKPALSYSGFIANELEACKNSEMVAESIRRSIDDLGLAITSPAGGAR